MSRKPYSATLDEYGRSGELVVHSKLRESGYAQHHPNGSYGEDVSFVGPSGERFYVEVERMMEKRWKNGSETFKHPDLTLVKDRKYGPDIIHVQLSSDMTHGFVTFFPDHADAHIREKPVGGIWEQFLVVDIERALLWKLSDPIVNSFAHMNYRRVKDLVESVHDDVSYAIAKRALVGRRVPGGGEPFRQPYGCSFDEWACWLVQIGEFLECSRLDPARPHHQQMNLFS